MYTFSVIYSVQVGMCNQWPSTDVTRILVFHGLDLVPLSTGLSVPLLLRVFLKLSDSVFLNVQAIFEQFAENLEMERGLITSKNKIIQNFKTKKIDQKNIAVQERERMFFFPYHFLLCASLEHLWPHSDLVVVIVFTWSSRLRSLLLDHVLCCHSLLMSLFDFFL